MGKYKERKKINLGRKQKGEKICRSKRKETKADMKTEMGKRMCGKGNEWKNKEIKYTRGEEIRTNGTILTGNRIWLLIKCINMYIM